MRAADIIAALPDLSPDIALAIRDLDARAYQRNDRVELNELQVHARLTAAIKAAGSMSALARQMGIRKQTLHAVLNGDRPTPPAVLRHLRLRRIPAGRTLYTTID